MHVQQTINCKGVLLDLSTPVVMGILNLTPDSFFDGGRWLDDSNYLKQVEKMLKEGTSIIDIGGMSSRPGAETIAELVELNRVVPVIEQIAVRFPEAILSIDTWRAKVAKEAVGAGAHIVNDISGGDFDAQLWATVAALKVPYILMHIQGTPEDMQREPMYEDVLTEMTDYFIHKIATLKEEGVRDIILDPGFGFGKTLTHNYRILANLKAFELLGLPILAGISRKSMICKALAINPTAALNGTTAANMLALQQGARILRVHDVREATESIKIWKLYQNELL
jgi:dihydropteroate synthase